MRNNGIKIDGEKLKREIAKSEYSQKKLAEMIGVHETTVSKFIKNGIITKPSLLLISHFLEVEPDYFLPVEEEEVQAKEVNFAVFQRKSIVRFREVIHEDKSRNRGNSNQSGKGYRGNALRP